MKANERKSKNIQLNIVTFVDVARATRTNSLDGCVYMMDNNSESKGQGSPKLETLCQPGQVLNWIIYAMDADQLPSGKFPPSVKISNIVFIDENRKDVNRFKVSNDLQIFGSPDKIRSKYTPVYYYWAGTVSDSVTRGSVYKYRFVLELDTKDPTKKIYLNYDMPSLKIENSSKGGFGTQDPNDRSN